ncbi:MAG: YgjV family protein, partial [Bacilli bacterium]|nr:YgjV family protein [Bacilli bacterium]
NSIIFILFMNNKSDIGFKILTIVYVLFWLVHDIYIKSYTTALFDVLTIGTSFYAIINLKFKKRQN